MFLSKALGSILFLRRTDNSLLLTAMDVEPSLSLYTVRQCYSLSKYLGGVELQKNVSYLGV